MEKTVRYSREVRDTIKVAYLIRAVADDNRPCYRVGVRLVIRKDVSGDPPFHGERLSVVVSEPIASSLE